MDDAPLEMTMQDQNKTDVQRERLSALLDGELDAPAVGEACGAWREDGSMRRTWHAYHLIGDVLRSDDLASDPARDVAFIGRLRARLAHEPAVLAPAAPAAEAKPARSRRSGWTASAAVAAGFMVVAAVLVVTRAPAPSSPGSGVAGLAAPAASVPVAQAVSTTGAAVAGLPMPVTQGMLIRDAQLDRYLAAHKQFAGSSALGVPSAFLRSATADASGR